MTIEYLLIALISTIFVFIIYRIFTRNRHLPREKMARNAGFLDLTSAEICDVRRNKIIITMQRDIDHLKHDLAKLRKEVHSNRTNVRNVADMVDNIRR